jgi:MFS family permease
VRCRGAERVGTGTDVSHRGLGSASIRSLAAPAAIDLECRVTSRLRPAHGVGLLFLANGLSHPSLWPRFPEIRDAVGASDATFGLALLGTGVGGVIGSVLAPRLTRSLGTDRAATVSAVALALATVTVGFVPSVATLFAAFGLMGLTDGVADIGQNALLFDVQRAGSRSLASRMHAVWSSGALAGTAIGTLAATARVSVLVQAAVLAVVATALVLVGRAPVRRTRTTAAAAYPEVLPTAVAPDPASDVAVEAPVPRRPRARMWALVAVAGVVVSAVEAVANEWSALTLRDGLGSSLTLAGLGPTAYAGAMLVGRLFGDRGIDRFGPRRMARLGGGAVVLGGGLGLALASWLGVPALLVAGLIVAGVGTATLFPLMLAAGDGLDASGRGVAAASLGARAGFLIVPVSVGFVSDRAGPTLAFALLPVAGLLAAVVLPAALRRPESG